LELFLFGACLWLLIARLIESFFTNYVSFALDILYATFVPYVVRRLAFYTEILDSFRALAKVKTNLFAKMSTKKLLIAWCFADELRKQKDE